MRTRARLALTFALPLLAQPSVSVDELRLLPEKGLSLRKTFLLVRESENESEFDGGTSTSSGTMERELVVVDEIEDVDDERITKLIRTYGEISTESESTWGFDGEIQNHSTDGESDLEDATVVFTWDADEKAYVATSDDVDDDVLPELAFDYDFAAFLPDGDVTKGDEWEVDLEAFRAALDPWAGIPWDISGPDGETISTGGDEGDFEPPDIDESQDGEITVTYAGTRDEDGVTVAVLEIEGEFERERTIESSQDFDGGSSESVEETTEEGTVEGLLLWNVEGGHFHSLEIEIESETTSSTESTFSFGGREFENSSESEGTQTRTLTASCTAAESD